MRITGFNAPQGKSAAIAPVGAVAVVAVLALSFVMIGYGNRGLKGSGQDLLRARLLIAGGATMATLVGLGSLSALCAYTEVKGHFMKG